MAEEKKSQWAQNEEKVLEFWQKNKVFEQSVDKEAPQGDYVFYDGPPFITGLPHYATLLPSIIKDVVPRYWTMKGFKVERIWGWDCHGLPAENKVEQELELKNKKDIDTLGVDKFVNACRSYVTNVSDQWNWYIDRIGRWVDMDNAYKTMDLDFMESVIWSFKELYEKGLIYEGYRSSLHCPRCATPLSKFELTMDAGSYQEVTETSVVLRFKLKEKENTYILAWTTTPWTLPGNLALAVGKKIDYVEVKIGDDNYIIAKERMDAILEGKKYEVVKELKGEELLGFEYEPLFDLKNKEISDSKTVYKVYDADFVSIEDGTGVVHIAPNFGEDDFELGKKAELPLVDIMDESGHYLEETGEWSGLYFKKAGKKVMEILGDKLFSDFEYTHSYPFCHRCGTPLIYKTQKAWYLRIEQVRKKLLKTNKDINWVPDYFKEGRFKNNLETAPDWCLSRSRYWGSPIPVWRCDKCDEMKVIGSLKELKELSGQTVKDLHRPDIDEVDFKCDKCDGTMKRVSEVLDCWFESGSMPYAQWHYPFKRKDDFKKIFPADFIIEYTGQLRGWFYYLHVLSNCLFDSASFKNVIVTGVLAGTDGRKMSKSYGNYPDPKGVLEKYGGDALRMYFVNSSIMLGDDMSLSEKDIENVLRKNVVILNNVYKFYKMFVTDEKPELVASDNLLDKWILSKLNQLINEVTENMEKYDLPRASRPITDFIDDLSTWYVRRSRDRFKGQDVKDKEVAIKITGYVLEQLIKVIAPFMPFMAEFLWQDMTGNDYKKKNKSVHLEEWPQVAAELIDTKLMEQMEVVRKIIEQALSVRAENNLKVRQPLSKLYITKKSLPEELHYLIKDEVNVKKIEVVGKLPEGDNYKISTDENYKVALDIEINDELKIEGNAREMIRLINAMRKKQGLSIGDLVNVTYKTDSDEIKETIKKLGDEIKQSTLTKELTEGEADEKLDINGQEIFVKIG